MASSRVIKITKNMLGRGCEDIPAVQIGIQHISEYSVGNAQINAAKLVYYLLPTPIGEYVAKILKNVLGELGLVTQGQLDIEMGKAFRPAPRAIITQYPRQSPISQQPQSQAALSEQLNQLIGLANKAGLYDAADWIEAKRQ